MRACCQGRATASPRYGFIESRRRFANKGNMTLHGTLSGLSIASFERIQNRLVSAGRCRGGKMIGFSPAKPELVLHVLERAAQFGIAR